MEAQPGGDRGWRLLQLGPQRQRAGEGEKESGGCVGTCGVWCLPHGSTIVRPCYTGTCVALARQPAQFEPLSTPPPSAPPQLGHGNTEDCNQPTLVPSLSAGSIDVDALNLAARPTVAYSVAPSDRYAVVPESGDGGSGDGLAAASGRDEVPDAQRDAKRSKV